MSDAEPIDGGTSVRSRSYNTKTPPHRPWNRNAVRPKADDLLRDPKQSNTQRPAILVQAGYAAPVPLQRGTIQTRRRWIAPLMAASVPTLNMDRIESPQFRKAALPPVRED